MPRARGKSLPLKKMNENLNTIASIKLAEMKSKDVMKKPTMTTKVCIFVTLYHLLKVLDREIYVTGDALRSKQLFYQYEFNTCTSHPMTSLNYFRYPMTSFVLIFYSCFCTSVRRVHGMECNQEQCLFSCFTIPNFLVLVC